MIDVFSQGYEAGLLFCAGIMTGLLYDLLTAIGRSRPAPVRHALDVLLLLLATGLLLLAALLASNGCMRGFYLAADALGAFASAWAFAPLFSRKNRNAKGGKGAQSRY